MQAFVRTDDKPIRVRAEVREPDVVAVLDSGLLDIVNVTDGLKDSGTIIVNTKKTSQEIKARFGKWKVAVVDASTIARETIGVPIVNTTMIGAILRATDIVTMASLEEPLKHRFGGRWGGNLQACKKAYEATLIF